MTYTIMIFVTRREHYTVEGFKDHIENQWIPLLQKITGKLFPSKYTRHYVARVASGAGARAGVATASDKKAPAAAPVVLLGAVNDIDWDFCATMEFRDELHFQQFWAVVNSEAGEELQDDEAKYSDADKLKIVVIGDTIVSEKS